MHPNAPNRYWTRNLPRPRRPKSPKNLLMTWEGLCPYLSFTVENETADLHEIRVHIMNEIFHYLKLLQFINKLKKICILLSKKEFWAHCAFKNFDLKKDSEYLYRLFDVSPKHTMKIRTSTSLHSTMISRWTWAKFMQILTCLVWSEMTLDMFLSAGRWLYL